MDNKNNNKKTEHIVVRSLKSNNKNYRIHSTVISDQDFDDMIEELMNQELAYGDLNYY